MKRLVACYSLGFLTLSFSVFVQAQGGAESMDRPSAKLPTVPAFKTPSAEPFTLPPVLPETSTDSLALKEKLTVKQIVIEGNTVLDKQLLREAVQAYENRVVTIAELENLRKQLTQLYLDAGYVNSGATIPSDGFQNGVLRYVMVEGKIDEIRIRGQEHLRPEYLKNRLISDTDSPFNLTDLQDNFQVLLSDPLISRLNGRILLGDSVGHSILDVDVTRTTPYQLSLLGNNQRPPSIGSEAFGINGGVRNLTGFGEAWDFTFWNSAGSNRYAGGLNAPITDWGTNAFFHFDESDSQVLENPLKKINIQSQVHSLEGGLNHFFINSPRHRLNVGGLLAIRENETSLLNRSFSFNPGISTGRNQATVFRTFQDYLWRGEQQALALRSTFSIGINALGATPANQNYPSSEFFAWLGQFQYAQQVLENGAQIVLRGNSQLTDKLLLPLERLSIGGMYTVRGYRENTLVRDEGFSLSAEFHYPIYGNQSAGDDIRVSLVPFSDFGRAWNLSGTDQVATSLASVGAGLDFQFKSLHGEFYYGYALYQNGLQHTDDLQDQGLHFQTRLDLF